MRLNEKMKCPYDGKELKKCGDFDEYQCQECGRYFTFGW